MTTPYTARHPLGILVGGSVEKGLQVRLDPAVPLESVKIGAFAVVQGADLTYFATVTDVSLEAVDPRYRSSPPDVSNPFIAQVLTGASVYGQLQITPSLALAVAGESQSRQAGPARSLPPPFARVSTASQRDVELVFGKEGPHRFVIGTPLDMDTQVCLDIERLVQRSTGVFGKSGTGKTFLTRLLLIGILQSGAATNLVFDMHGEYGWAGSREGGAWVKGLKQLFPSQVAVFTLDPDNARRRGLTPDFEVRIGQDEIEPEDIKALQDTLGLSDVAADAAFELERRFGPGRWLQAFLDLSGDDFATLARDLNLHQGALSALQNRLRRLQRLPFLVEKAPQGGAVRHLLDFLDRGYHVVLEFGRFGDDLTAYILVANLLTRRLHTRYRERKEAAAGDRAAEPRPLVITIEEAHKFLNPQVASQTIFGAIAREMRKYNVTLLVVDQRPGAIDTEVMSQVGTKITCLLDDDRDVDAVLAGASGRRELRTVLARLEPQQQALIFGHAVPMPVVVRTREYGSEASYASLAPPPPSSLRAPITSGRGNLAGQGDPARPQPPISARPELVEGARRQREMEELFGEPLE